MSAISARCPHCHERLAVPSEAVGRPFTCPRCQTVVGLADEGNTVIDGEVPDFSYLKQQVERDDDILVGENLEDGESALGESPTNRPTSRPTAKAAPPAPAPVVYTPPPAAAGNPFSGLSDRHRKSPPAPQPAPTPDPPPKARDRHEPADPVARTPVWVWPVLIALAVYAVAATGLAAWGWMRPVAPAPTLVKPAR
jgi:endogenous inhibitor of DNA gyrase (YacG/DUF329 family)